MAYVEAHQHQTIVHHPKTKRLCRALGIYALKPAEAVLLTFWQQNTGS